MASFESTQSGQQIAVCLTEYSRSGHDIHTYICNVQCLLTRFDVWRNCGFWPRDWKKRVSLYDSMRRIWKDRVAVRLTVQVSPSGSSRNVAYTAHTGESRPFNAGKSRIVEPIQKPVPVAARSKAWVCGRPPVEIVGSNPTEGMDVCLLWVFYVVRYRSLRRFDHSSREVLPTMVRRWVWSRNLVNEDALAHWGMLRQINK